MNNKSLKEISELHKVDKNGFDHFHEIYDPHLTHLRDTKINLVEIGVGGYNDPYKGGESLKMWKDYFSLSNIYGIDICDKSPLEEERIKIFKGSQSNIPFLEEVYNTIGKIDVIVDDGSHVSKDVITTFEYYFPKLESNGIYIIEDLGTSYWRQFGGGSHEGTSMNYLKKLADGLNHTEYLIEDYVPTYFDQNIKSIHFYRNAAVIYKGDNTKPSVMVKNGRFRLR
jgi:hypothetical protein